MCCRPFRCVAEKEVNVLLHWKSICIQLRVSVTLTGPLRQTGAAKKVISPNHNPGSYHFCNILCHESVSSSWIYQITMAPRSVFFFFYLQGSHTLICTTPCFGSVVFPSKPMKSWKSSRGFGNRSDELCFYSNITVNHTCLCVCLLTEKGVCHSQWESSTNSVESGTLPNLLLLDWHDLILHS